MNKKVLLIGLICLVPLIAVLGVGFKFDPNIVKSPLLGKEAPDFALQDLDGALHRLSDLKGQPVVINFWATYCAPCYAEHPLLIASARRWAGEANFLGVIYQDEPDLIRRWEQELGAWGPSLVDQGNKMAIAYGVYGPPETFFIDRGGKVVEKVIGAVSPEQMETIMQRLLQEPLPEEPAA